MTAASVFSLVIVAKSVNDLRDILNCYKLQLLKLIACQSVNLFKLQSLSKWYTFNNKIILGKFSYHGHSISGMYIW